MSRQHRHPILIGPGGGEGRRLTPLSINATTGNVDERFVQQFVHDHPDAIPIDEIDPIFSDPISICMELNTPAGPVDNFLVTPSGLPVLVECKLWRNPEARREVVGQIIDYAKELRRWSSADIHREVNRRLGTDALIDLVRRNRDDFDEAEFNDRLTINLRRGRFLLLIVGDGIREGVEAIAEYVQSHTGLHFSLGLVELPIYELPDGSRLVSPRVLAKTTTINRTVVSLPEGFAIAEDDQVDVNAPPDSVRDAAQVEQKQFWSEFLSRLVLDDPEQRVPNPARMGYIAFTMPAPNGSSWLTVYRDKKAGRVGIFLSCSRGSAGEYARRAIVDDWESVRKEIGGTVALQPVGDGPPRIGDELAAGSLDDAGNREKAYAWLVERVNAFVNSLRPRVRSAVADWAADTRHDRA